VFSEFAPLTRLCHNSTVGKKDVYKAMKMAPELVLRIQGLVEFSGVGLFFVGLFVGEPIVSVIGGLIMVLDDLFEMAMGILNPLFPVLFATVLATLIDPWYMGIFWSLAVFHVLGIPTSLIKIFRTKRWITSKNIESIEKLLNTGDHEKSSLNIDGLGSDSTRE